MRNSNAEALCAVLKPEEKYVKITISSANGPYQIPNTGCLPPSHTPENLVGLAFFDTYNAAKHEVRRKCSIFFPGPNGSKSDANVPSAQPSTEASDPLKDQIAKIVGRLTETQPGQATHAPTPPEPPSLPPTIQRTLPAAPTVPNLDRDPNLPHEISVAQATQLRSYVIQTEEATSSAVELEKMALIKESQYTREIGEWQQLGTAFRKELYAAQAGFAEKAIRHFDAIDYAASRLLRMSDEVARRVKDPLFQPAPPPPPPPPPPPDYTGIVIAAINAAATIGSAITGREKPSQAKKDTVLSLLASGATSGPLGFAQTAISMEKDNPVDGSNSSLPDSFQITKSELLELAETNILGLTGGDSAKLADLVREDKLHTMIPKLAAPIDGVYTIQRKRLKKLAKAGTLTLLGSSERLLEILESGKLSDLTELVRNRR